jgi:hypothetical protein
MVLDVKALTWASRHNIDTAKLKAAKMPIYGKWYFPEIPAGVPLINLETGERRIFSERMLAGEVIWVKEADLQRARLGPYAEQGDGAPRKDASGPTAPPAQKPPGRAEPEPEPLIMMLRPPVTPSEGRAEPAPEAAKAGPEVPAEAESPEGEADLSSIHLPSPSIAPLVLAFGLSIGLLGLATHIAILLVGLAWVLAGAIGWVRIGVLEAHAAHANHS